MWLSEHARSLNGRITSHHSTRKRLQIIRQNSYATQAVDRCRYGMMKIKVLRLLFYSSFACLIIHPSDMFDSCIIHADLSQLICDRNLVRPLFKNPYWRVEFDIELTFGTTEIEANIAWTINVSILPLYDVYIVLKCLH